MASNDSGVDTSNDSFCTNDNSNNNSANTSMSGQEACSSSSIMEALCQSAQSFESFQSTPYEGGSSSSSQSFRRPDRTSEWNRKDSRRYQHHHTTRHALVPYVCKLPNERKLRLAASVSNIELLVRLLDSGVNPDAADEHLRTPLHLSASRGQYSIQFTILSFHHKISINRAYSNKTIISTLLLIEQRPFSSRFCEIFYPNNYKI